MSRDSPTTPRYAFVTLLTTDAYLPGALVLAHSLRRAHSLAHNPTGTLTPADIANLGPAGLSSQVDVEPKVELICFVTPSSISVKSVKALLRAFDKVVGVEPLTFAGFAAAQINQGKGKTLSASRSEERRAARKARAQSRKKLALLGRPDLGEGAGAALTKLHAWRLTGYEKVIFLDADMLVLRPLAHLFSLTSALAASPDIGWPDAFNSGLLVLTPSLGTFADIRKYAITRGSWDGADQGLLNDYFGGDEQSGEAGRGGGWQRLPFRYNVTPSAGYTFKPAYERYGNGIMAAHFIGANKPWDRPKPTSAPSSSPSSRHNNGDADALFLRWHEAFEEYYPSTRSHGGSAAVVHSERGVEVVERPYSVPTYRAVWEAESEVAASGSEQSSSGVRRGPVRTRGVRNKSTAASLIRGAYQAEDLPGMFQDGVVAASIAAEVSSLVSDVGRIGEGVYMALPLDGRVTLMGPELDSGAEEDSPNSDETIQADKMGSKNEGDPDSGLWSPPIVSWDPAREPPPVGGGSSDYQMREPVDAFYVNAWDQASQPKGKAAFFDVSNYPITQTRTLEQLQKDHYFDNLGTLRPDPSLVKAVFPWESNQTSSASSRIFPDEEFVGGRRDPTAESPGEASSGSASIDTSSSSKTTPSTQQALSPPGGNFKRMSSSLNYANAWDQVSAIGAKYDRPKPQQQVSSSRGVQTAGEEARASRSSQTVNAKYRHRGLQADGSGDWEERGPGMSRGMRDASADQSADGDNESSSSSSGDEEDNQGGTTRWRREGPGPGYQRKAEKHNEQVGASPRSPRLSQHVSLGGGSGVSSRGSTTMVGNRSRSSSSGAGGGSVSPNFLAPNGVTTSNVTRHRLRPESGLPFVEEGAVSPSLDMSLSTAYEGATSLEGDSTRWTNSHISPRTSPPLTFAQPAFESGHTTPTTLMTPSSQSPVASRADLRQAAQSQVDLSSTAGRRRAL